MNNLDNFIKYDIDTAKTLLKTAVNNLAYTLESEKATKAEFPTFVLPNFIEFILFERGWKQEGISFTFRFADRVYWMNVDNSLELYDISSK